MSLKAFHIFFVIVSFILTIGVGFWGVRSYLHISDVTNLIIGVLSFVSAIGLFFYFGYVLKKYKDLSVLAFAMITLLKPYEVLSCSTCYGDPDSIMSKGLNMGVLSLLIIITVVLSLFGLMIFNFRKRAKIIESPPL